MAVYFRAAVMLSTLVGLPAAWIYYGPLPAGAQRVVDRFLEVAREAVSGQRQPPVSSAWDQEKTAPRFNEAHLGELPSEAPRFDGQPTATQLPGPSGSPISLVSATLPETDPPLSSSNELAGQLEPHFSLLRQLGVADYTLAQWGTEGNLYRFHCSIPFGDEGLMSRQFDAIEADPVAAVRQVVGEVTSWQNARLDDGNRRSQWR